MQATTKNQFIRGAADSQWITVGASFCYILVQELGEFLPASEQMVRTSLWPWLGQSNPEQDRITTAATTNTLYTP